MPRQKGTKNPKRITITVEAPTCPNCGNTSMTRKRKLDERSNRNPNAQYCRHQVYSIDCRSCGTAIRLTVRTPNITFEPPPMLQNCRRQ